jgi:two-component system OmpR family response regulator
MDGGKAMVVDDERFFLTILGDFVTERLGMHPILVEDGAAALSALDTEAVELVLLDIIMPGMDGIEVLRGIKHRRPGLPVIMVTATSAIEHAIAALREGADDFVRKPLDLEALARAVEHVLRKGAVSKLPPAKEVSKDRRRSARVRMRAETPAQLHLMEVNLVDLSLSGALVEHTEPVRPGEIYRLSFPVSGKEVHVLARAVRAFASHRVTVAGGERKVVYRTGMEFVGVEKSAADAIAAYVNRFL